MKIKQKVFEIIPSRIFLVKKIAKELSIDFSFRIKNSIVEIFVYSEVDKSDLKEEYVHENRLQIMI